MQEPPLSFGKQLKYLRERAGLSQEQLAERAGLTAKGISALERGERKHPYPHTVNALAEALGLSESDRATWQALLTPRGAAPPAEPVKTAQFLRPLNEIIGREGEITTVFRFLESDHIQLLTLTGPGGVGKTRLALQIVQIAQTRFPDGAFFIPLDEVPGSGLVLSTICHMLGLQERGSQLEIQILSAYLKTKNMLLVLDNFEHVLGAASEISPILSACPGVKILVTSRAPLRLQGEQEYPLLPLALPSLEHVPPVEEVQASPAVTLFVQRARAITPSFSLTPTNAVTITAICRRLDGLPLALELAAARLKILTPTALLKRLDQTLPLLVGGARDLPERQQTMRQTIAWSYQLLTSEEQCLFRRLAVFAGTWTLDAAEFVCHTVFTPDEVLEGIASLMDKSLLQRIERGESGRYGLLHTIRAYALEQLQIAGEEESVQERHLECVLNLAKEAGEQINGPDQARWLMNLEDELANLRAALEWAFSANQTDGEQIANGLQIVCALYRFWQGRGYLSEGQMWLKRGLSHPVQVSDSVHALALNNLGWLMHQQGETHQAIEIQQKSVALYRQLKDKWGVATALDGLGDAAWAQGNFALAATAYEESLAIRRLLGDRHEIALSLYSLGRLQLDQNAIDLAEPMLGEAFTRLTQLNDYRGIALVHHALGRLELKKGNPELAFAHVQKALATFWNLVNKVDIAECLEVLALIAKEKTQWEQGVHLWAVAAALRDTIGVPTNSHDEAMLAPLRALLPETQFDMAWQVGYGQPLDIALETIIGKLFQGTA